MAIDFLQVAPSASILLANLGQYFFGISLSVTGIFLILLVLSCIDNNQLLGDSPGESASASLANDEFCEELVVSEATPTAATTTSAKRQPLTPAA